jgi:hypothetical protein
MNQKSNHWKKKMINIYEEDQQKSIKNHVKSAILSKSISEYFLKVKETQEAANRFE